MTDFRTTRPSLEDISSLRVAPVTLPSLFSSFNKAAVNGEMKMDICVFVDDEGESGAIKD
eukprot:CAMPEP_0175040872 /NCGR_PEP_ID=MMETSP0052_2-20121109/1547_1 /TAXON_ID=51329 ORGANISM="Polytomella parva, Strain SAG 63-3" /NCGR_SAMPLE_ID=MMETSP0052_2 /ASSEMBLY_ACC=CAM_ASM_000194 /LENGTH=59 /DNA_ID=CAMNT_0016303217 /DNA_START=113 /DNA_END=292 /DNA_ORIENTATION=-